MKRKNIIFFLVCCSFIIPFKSNVLVNGEAKEKSNTRFELFPNDENLLVDADDLYFGDKTATNGEIKASTVDNTEVMITEATGLQTGWNLQVKFKEFSSGPDEIKGAELFFPKVNPISVVSGNIAEPTVYGNEDSFLGTTKKGLVVSSSGASRRLANANINEGYGRWLLLYENDDKVQLKLPKGKKEEGFYTALLEYTLVSGP